MSHATALITRRSSTTEKVMGERPKRELPKQFCSARYAEDEHSRRSLSRSISPPCAQRFDPVEPARDREIDRIYNNRYAPSDSRDRGGRRRSPPSTRDGGRVASVQSRDFRRDDGRNGGSNGYSGRHGSSLGHRDRGGDGWSSPPNLNDLPGFCPGLFSGIDFEALNSQIRQEAKRVRQRRRERAANGAAVPSTRDKRRHDVDNDHAAPPNGKRRHSRTDESSYSNPTSAAAELKDEHASRGTCNNVKTANSLGYRKTVESSVGNSKTAELAAYIKTTTTAIRSMTSNIAGVVRSSRTVFETAATHASGKTSPSPPVDGGVKRYSMPVVISVQPVPKKEGEKPTPSVASAEPANKVKVNKDDDVEDGELEDSGDEV